MQDFDSRYIDGIVDGSGQYQMDVDVNCIAFSHHHLFSREHVLSSRLTQLYSQYTTRYNRNMVNLLTDKVCRPVLTCVLCCFYVESDDECWVI